MARRIDPLLPYQLFILPSPSSPAGIRYQQENGIIETYVCHNPPQQSIAPYLQAIIDLTVMAGRVLRNFLKSQ